MQEKQTLLQKEVNSGAILMVLILGAIITGFTSFFIDEHNDWIQVLWIMHTVTGLLLSLQFVPYTLIHVQRTLAFRRWLLVGSGVLLLVVVLVLVVTGMWMIFFGQTEVTRWLLRIHFLAAFTFVALVALHLIMHAKTLSQKRRQTMPKSFQAAPQATSQKLFAAIVVNILVAVAGYGVISVLNDPYSSQPVVADYQYRYGEHPFRPSQTETWHDQFVDERQIANSLDCAGCHQEIAAEWMSSVHRQAASDVAYVTNVSLLANKAGIAATRYCEGCHAPVALLTGQLSPGGEHGGIAGSIGNFEGVGCLGCHGIESVVHLNGVASYEFKAKHDYLLGSLDTPVTNQLRHFLIRLRPEQHRQDLARSVLGSPTLCATCHAQFMDKDMNNWGWVKMQDEYSAWLDSPYSQQHNQLFASREVIRCHDCHMPLVKGNDPSANKNGEHRSHRFLGANTMVPLLSGDVEQLALTKDFLQKNKMRISIEEPRRSDATQTLHNIDESIRTDTQTPFYVHLGESVDIRVVISNIGVGHNFPGGTLDINEAWVAFMVIDAAGKRVYESGAIQADNTVDPDAHFYRSLPIDKEGNLVWKHDLFNRVGEAYKDFVPAGQSDIISYRFRVPEWAKGPLTLSATLKYRKLNERYARWALKDAYQAIPIIDVARSSIAVPIKEKPEIEQFN